MTMREGPFKGESKSVEMKEVGRAIKNAEVWKAGLVWMLFNIATTAFLSWGPTLFQDFKGLSPFYASLLTSVLMYAAAMFVPFFGWTSDRFRRRKSFILTGQILMALALIATAYTFDLTLLFSVIALGIAAAMIPPIVMTITAESLPARLAGTGFSIITLCQNIGITLSAPLAGYIIQITHSLPLTFFAISLFAFAGAIITPTMKTK